MLPPCCRQGTSSCKGLAGLADVCRATSVHRPTVCPFVQPQPKLACPCCGMVWRHGPDAVSHSSMCRPLLGVCSSICPPHPPPPPPPPHGSSWPVQAFNAHSGRMRLLGCSSVGLTDLLHQAPLQPSCDNCKAVYKTAAASMQMLDLDIPMGRLCIRRRLC